MFQVSASQETYCFASAAVVCRLRVEKLFKRFKEIEITGTQAGSLVFDLLPHNGW